MSKQINIQGTFTLQGSSVEYPRNVSIPEYFKLGFQNGLIRPNDLAIVDGNRQHTFQQLDDISTKISNVILELTHDVPNQNPDGDLVIAICSESCDTLTAILFGILKARAAYLPIHMSFTEKRIENMVNDCRPILVICDVPSKFQTVEHLTKLVNTKQIIEKINLVTRNMGRSESSGDADDTAMILYTSGSSGEPKGVRLSHKVTFSRLNWFWTEFPFVQNEKCVLKTSLTFIDSITEIFGTLLKGFQITVFDKTALSRPSVFVEKLNTYQITRVMLVPALLKEIFQVISTFEKCERRRQLNSVKLWISGGEPLSPDILSEFFEIFFESSTLVNSYGTTEVGDVTFVKFSTAEDIDKKLINNSVPNGFPQLNMAIYILDENLQPVEKGEVGEVFIAGSNLAKGYVGISNSDSFLNNPFANGLDNTILYKTRDHGSISHDLNGDPVLLYHGRSDSQIKVRGHRVDLIEIELAISGFQFVQKVKVLCSHPGKSDQSLVAFIVPISHDITAKRHIIQETDNKLPEYKHPIIRFIKEIPLLVNGKTDRQLLLNMFTSERVG